MFISLWHVERIINYIGMIYFFKKRKEDRDQVSL